MARSPDMHDPREVSIAVSGAAWNCEKESFCVHLAGVSNTHHAGAKPLAAGGGLLLASSRLAPHPSRAGEPGLAGCKTHPKQYGRYACISRWRVCPSGALFQRQRRCSARRRYAMLRSPQPDAPARSQAHPACVHAGPPDLPTCAYRLEFQVSARQAPSRPYLFPPSRRKTNKEFPGRHLEGPQPCRESSGIHPRAASSAQ